DDGSKRPVTITDRSRVLNQKYVLLPATTVAWLGNTSFFYAGDGILEKWSPWGQQRLGEFCDVGSRLPFVEGELHAVRHVDLEYFSHPLGDRGISDGDVDLIVALEGQPVEVGRADRRPDAVNGAGLGMHHGPLVEKESYSLMKEPVVVATAQ
ncbi:MAG: hypothetical protein Q613_PSC00210G0001, partial [Propionibacterium sp. DORA_15]